MGRRKIEIQPITHERNRAVTFVKRKNGLFKKAYELGVLCSVDVAVIIFEDRTDQHPKLHQYCSSSIEIDDIVRRHRAHSGDTDTRGPADFGSTSTPGSKKAAIAQDLDDDDDDEEAAEVPVRGGRGRGTSGRAPVSTGRPTPNLSAVRSAPTPARRSLPLRQAAAKRRRYAEDDDDDDGDEDDEYKQRDGDEDAEGDEDADGDYEYTAAGTSRRSGRMAETAAELLRTASVLPVSNDRGGNGVSERGGSRNKRARVDEGPARRTEEIHLRSNPGDYAGSYRADHSGAYREEPSSGGYRSSGLRLRSRSRSPLRSSYPYPYPASGPGSSSYPPSGPGISGYAPSRIGPGPYPPAGDIYSYPPPHPPQNPYPGSHMQQNQHPQYGRAPHRPFYTDTASPIPGSPHSFSTSSPHPFPNQHQYPPLPPSAQQNGYPTPPLLRLEPPMRGDESYPRSEGMYPPSSRSDSTYMPPPLLPQYTLPPLDISRSKPAYRDLSPPRAASDHVPFTGELASIRRRARYGELTMNPVGSLAGIEMPDTTMDEDRVRRARDGGVMAGLAMSNMAAAGVGAGGAAPVWEGAGTARELLNAFMATPGVERAVDVGGDAGANGDLDWPVHAPPATRATGAAGSVGVAGGDSVAVAVGDSGDQPAAVTTNPEADKMIPPAKEDEGEPVPGTEASKNDVQPTTVQTAAPIPEDEPTPLTSTSPGPANPNTAVTPGASSTQPSISGAQLVTPAPPSGNLNAVDWLAFLSGAAAEAGAVGGWVNRRGANADVDTVVISGVLDGNAGVPGESAIEGASVVEATGDAGMAVDEADAAGSDLGIDAEGEPDVEALGDEDVNVDMQPVLGGGPTDQGAPVAPIAAGVGSNASSPPPAVQAEPVPSMTVEETSVPQATGGASEKSMKVEGGDTIDDVALGSSVDHVVKDEAEDAMNIDGVV